MRRLVARDHREAYDLWARHFRDPALLANRDPASTRRKLARVVDALPLGPGTRLLDVGPGDGTLLRLAAPRVAHGLGVDPGEHSLAKLRALLRDLPNVALVAGTSERIPCADDSFDVVVVNSVLQILDDRTAIERSLRELVRVGRPGGLLFVGELPFRSELERGLWPQVGRRLREYGLAGLARTIWHVFVRPLLRGEPLLVYPARNLHVPRDEFEALCRDLGATVECRPHRERLRDSLTRNDYRVWLPENKTRSALA